MSERIGVTYKSEPGGTFHMALFAHAVDRRRQRNPSIFNGETFPDFIYSLVERIKSGVKGSVVKIKYVPDDPKSENPVVGFHID